MPRLCFVMGVDNFYRFFADRKDFLSRSYRYELSQVDRSGLLNAKSGRGGWGALLSYNFALSLLIVTTNVVVSCCVM